MDFKIDGNTPVNEGSLSINCSSSNGTYTYGTTNSDSTYTCWDYWVGYHYPTVIQSYPVYIQEKAKDKGKQAFEIVKILKDKKLVNITKVGQFIDLMDELIKIL